MATPVPDRGAGTESSGAAGLADRRCIPCQGGTPPLDRAQFAPLYAQLEGWQVQDDRMLVKVFRFKNFVQAVEFVNAVMPVAEAENHHPDLRVSWGQVRVELWTHKINGLSEADFVMAAKLDRVYSRPASTAAGGTG
ncbi:MAG TPA: 4a-hydroxytetrahydrobiopterin dehydratase [bacterium]|nr:4a-hydroxytetrahydrobiopterin dehydratase [bacterium]